MDEDISTGRTTLRLSKCDVRLIRVRDTDGQVEGAVRIAAVNYVSPLRGAAIAFELLVTDRREAKPDREPPQFTLSAIKG